MNIARGGRIEAVASRSSKRAHDYGDRFDVARRYDEYEALAGDDDIDVVYVATPHSRHETDTLMFLEAGKHVLCEKPLALNASQARRMVDVARGRGLFLMEAMWSRFLPAYSYLREALAGGRIGEALLVEADFGFRRPVDPAHRLFNPDLGGGALLDLGVYPLQLCFTVLGSPLSVSGHGVIGSTGVDEMAIGVLGYDGGRFGLIKAALRTPMACTARIAGTDATIELPAFMHCPDSLTITDETGSERIDVSYEGDGLRFQIDEVNRCLAAGETESDVMPLDETVAMASVLDELRNQVGVSYPGE